MTTGHSLDGIGEDDVLTKSRFHALLVAFQAPVSWPDWVVVSAAAGLAMATGAAWWPLSRDPMLSLVVAGMLAVFFAADALILSRLPQRRISFAPWKGQLFPLAIPRAGIALAAALSGLWWSWATALLLLAFAQFIGVVALYRGAIVEPGRLGLTTLSITVAAGQAAAAKPFRILHVSDIHLERLSVREEQLVAIAHAAQPDLILLTGDYVNLSNNADAVTHEQVRHLLDQLQARYGCYAVLGTPPVDWPAAIPSLFDGLPIRLLRDEAVVVTMSRGRSLTLLGLDCHHDIERDAATLDRVLATAPRAGPRILLYHSPELILEAARRDIDLYLCGHTHGGQVRLPLIGPLLTMSALGRRFVMGHYREGRTNLYVSRGIGFEGLGAPRVRLFCRPEVTLVTLVI